MFLKLFLNEMIRNINIPNILDIIEISKSIKLNKCTHYKNKNIYLNVSTYEFLKFDGSMKIKV